jgi:hypothetical protein
MATTSTICSSCKIIFGNDEGSDSMLSEIIPQPHHKTLDSFHHAVQKRCFVCLATWESFTEQHQAAWSSGSGSWEPMTYFLYEEKSETELVKLQLFYWDPLNSTTRDMRFRLIPVEGLLRSFSLISYICRRQRRVSP